MQNLMNTGINMMSKGQTGGQYGHQGYSGGHGYPQGGGYVYPHTHPGGAQGGYGSMQPGMYPGQQTGEMYRGGPQGGGSGERVGMGMDLAHMMISTQSRSRGTNPTERAALGVLQRGLNSIARSWKRKKYGGGSGMGMGHAGMGMGMGHAGMGMGMGGSGIPQSMMGQGGYGPGAPGQGYGGGYY